VLKLILFLHLITAIVALATSVHLVMRLITCLRMRGAFLNQVRLHAPIMAISYMLTVVLGMLMYPEFRYEVRHLLLDPHLPHLTGLFEIKEHFTALGLLPALALWILSRKLHFKEDEEYWYVPIFMGLALFVVAVLAYNSVIGWYLVTVKAV
jgi:hypothetical protein